MLTLLTVVHVIVCLFLIIVVLLQHGKGADIGATFGGSSQTLFGSEGPLPLLNKITTASAIVFMCTSMALAYYANHAGTESVMKGVAKPATHTEAVKPAVEKTQVPQAAPEMPTSPAAVNGTKEQAPAMPAAQTPETTSGEKTKAPEMPAAQASEEAANGEKVKAPQAPAAPVSKEATSGEKAKTPQMPATKTQEAISGGKAQKKAEVAPAATTAPKKHSTHKPEPEKKK